MLASASPRRRELLGSTGIPFIVVPAPESAEPRPDKGELPALFACRSAHSKGAAFLSSPSIATKVRSLTEADVKECLVISADTVVTLDGIILGKPANTAEALSFLRMLNNKQHTVITACCLFFDGKEESFSVASKVRFAHNAEAVLQAYAATGEGLDKAGAYAVQERGAALISGIEGSWTGVVGLPLAELMAKLLELHLIQIAQPPYLSG